jgi:hypothetical protein
MHKLNAGRIDITKKVLTSEYVHKQERQSESLRSFLSTTKTQKFSQSIVHNGIFRHIQSGKIRDQKMASTYLSRWRL